jgi:hypothetical protein
MLKHFLRSIQRCGLVSGDVKVILCKDYGQNIKYLLVDLEAARKHVGKLARLSFCLSSETWRSHRAGVLSMSLFMSEVEHVDVKSE